MQSLSLIQKIAVFAIPAIFAITVHEAAHGYVARYFGDRTAEMLGRLTLNPIKHIDLVGTIVVPLALLALSSPFLFGWAKPVPVAPRNFRKPRQHMAIVAAAGPVSNLAMALIWTAVLGIAASQPQEAPMRDFLFAMGAFGIFFNVILAVLNMLPLPPLDGGRVLSGFLSPRASTVLDRIEPYGFMIILVLLVSRVLSTIIGVPALYTTAAMCGLVDVSLGSCLSVIR